MDRNINCNNNCKLKKPCVARVFLIIIMHFHQLAKWALFVAAFAVMVFVADYQDCAEKFSAAVSAKGFVVLRLVGLVSVEPSGSVVFRLKCRQKDGLSFFVPTGYSPAFVARFFDSDHFFAGSAATDGLADHLLVAHFGLLSIPSVFLYSYDPCFVLYLCGYGYFYQDCEDLSVQLHLQTQAQLL